MQLRHNSCSSTAIFAYHCFLLSTDCDLSTHHHNCGIIMPCFQSLLIMLPLLGRQPMKWNEALTQQLPIVASLLNVSFVAKLTHIVVYKFISPSLAPGPA